MAAKKPPVNELKKRLEELLKLADNQICADCPERGPRWASATLGTFICINCSGIHRNLGVHISFVRSVNLDEWKAEHVEKMEQWGNARARAYYEANLPPTYAKPSDWTNVQQMTRWIKDKYEHKRFLPANGVVPSKGSITSTRPIPSSSPSPPSSTRDASPTTTNTPRERKPRDRPSLPSPTTSSLSSNSGKEPGSSTGNGKSSNGSNSVRSPVTLTAPALTKPPVPVPDLLDFNEPETPAPTPAMAPLPTPASTSFAAPTVLPSALQSVPDYQLKPQPSASQVPTPLGDVTSTGKPKLTPEQLLSMFNKPGPPQVPGPAWATPPPAPAYGMIGTPPLYPTNPIKYGGLTPGRGGEVGQALPPPQIQPQPQLQPQQQQQQAYTAFTGFQQPQQQQPYGVMAYGYPGPGPAQPQPNTSLPFMPPQQGSTYANLQQQQQQQPSSLASPYTPTYSMQQPADPFLLSQGRPTGQPGSAMAYGDLTQPSQHAQSAYMGYPGQGYTQQGAQSFSYQISTSGFNQQQYSR